MPHKERPAVTVASLPGPKGRVVMSSKAELVQLRPTEITPEERARRVQVEAERRARQSTVEWMFWLPSLAQQHGIPEAKLKQMIEAQVRANEKKEREAKAERRKREQRIERGTR